MTEKEIINALLGVQNEDGRESTLCMTLKGARELTDRDIRTGTLLGVSHRIESQVMNGTYGSNKFLGIAAYLIIIDLIGTLFKKKGCDNHGRSIWHALTSFTNLGEQQRRSLAILRHSLAHTFSLGNDTEVFSLDYRSDATDIIVPAKKPYHIGVRSSAKEAEHLTTVYYGNVCQLVEEMYCRLIELHQRGELELLPQYKDRGEPKLHHIRSMFFVK